MYCGMRLSCSSALSKDDEREARLPSQAGSSKLHVLRLLDLNLVSSFKFVDIPINNKNSLSGFAKIVSSGSRGVQSRESIETSKVRKWFFHTAPPWPPTQQLEPARTALK
jgi:hypothetical protein